MNNPLFLPVLLLCSSVVPLRAQAPAAAPVKLDFQAAGAGGLPDGLTVTDAEAKFSIVAEGENKFLQMNPSPLVDGGVLVGTSVKGAAMVSVRVRAEAKRRSQPRFGVGMHGVGGYRLLVVPAQKELQLVKNEEVVARVPFEWKPGGWTTVEFRVLAEGQGSRLEGRAWPEGGTRPVEPLLTLASTTPPAAGKASLWAAPYAGLPVDFDEVEIAPLP
jgi:hypothetical protein